MRQCQRGNLQMADDGEVFVNSKISCVSSKCVDEIISAVNDETRKIISKNVDWTDEQKERLRQRFTEIYANAFNVNIQIDCQSSSEAATDELEPINLDRRNYVNTTLLPALDQVIKRTTRSRKHCPLLCTQYLCREGKAEKKFLTSAVVKTESSISQEPTSLDKSFDDLQARLGRTCKDLKTLMKTLPETVDKFEQLQRALKMNSAMTSKTDDVIFNPLPEEDKMADSMTPLRKRLNPDEMPASPKKAKRACVLNRERLSKRHRGYKLK